MSADAIGKTSLCLTEIEAIYESDFIILQQYPLRKYIKISLWHPNSGECVWSCCVDEQSTDRPLDEVWDDIVKVGFYHSFD